MGDLVTDAHTFLSKYWTTMLGSTPWSVSGVNRYTYNVDPEAIPAVLQKGTFAAETVCYSYVSLIKDTKFVPHFSSKISRRVRQICTLRWLPLASMHYGTKIKRSY